MYENPQPAGGMPGNPDASDKPDWAAAVVQSAEDRVEHDPQLKHRDMHPVVSHPEIGEFEYEGYPVKLSRTPAFVHGRGPLLREHNRYVYGELLGLSDEEMKSLENDKVI